MATIDGYIRGEHVLEFLHGQINFDDTMVCYYDELPLWSSPFGILLLNNVPLQKNVKIVDLGCGTGFPLLELAQRYGDSCKLFGIDPWDGAIDRALGKKEQYRIKNVELIKGSGEDTPFGNEYIDMVISNLGVNNFADPDAVMQECFRIIKPQGKLIFTTNLAGHFAEFYAVFSDVLHALQLEDEVTRLNNHIKRRHSIESIKALVNRNKFSVRRIVQEQYIMRFVDGSAFFNHYFIKLAFLPAWKAVVREDHWDVVFAQLEQRLNSLADRDGELVLRVPMAYIECEK